MRQVTIFHQGLSERLKDMLASGNFLDLYKVFYLLLLRGSHVCNVFIFNRVLFKCLHLCSELPSGSWRPVMHQTYTELRNAQRAVKLFGSKHPATLLGPDLLVVEKTQSLNRLGKLVNHCLGHRVQGASWSTFLMNWYLRMSKCWSKMSRESWL